MQQPGPPEKRVLVVDDDLAQRRLVVKILQRQGFDCNAAASVVEAQGLLETKPYGLLITDMRMWGEEGLELIRFASEVYPGMAAIMISGMDDPELERKALQSGASAFIQKPVTEEELMGEVDAALQKREQTIKLRSHLDR